MRCAKCGRLLPGHGPSWALKCSCAGTGPQVPHPCSAESGCGRSIDCVFSRGMPDCDALRAWLATVSMDPMVEAVRADKVVGEGTCSHIAECMGFGNDLRRELALAGCATVAAALRWARGDERLWLEEGTNQREGSDDDWQLGALRDFERGDKAHPV